MKTQTTCGRLLLAFRILPTRRRIEEPNFPLPNPSPGPGEALAIGTEGDAVGCDPVRITGKCESVQAALHVPEFDSTVGAYRNQMFVVSENHTLDGALMSIQGMDQPAGMCVPDLHGFVVAAGSD